MARQTLVPRPEKRHRRAPRQHRTLARPATRRGCDGAKTKPPGGCRPASARSPSSGPWRTKNQIMRVSSRISFRTDDACGLFGQSFDWIVRMHPFSACLEIAPSIGALRPAPGGECSKRSNETPRIRRFRGFLCPAYPCDATDKLGSLSTFRVCWGSVRQIRPCQETRVQVGNRSSLMTISARRTAFMVRLR
jgi:hypothetical protein